MATVVAGAEVLVVAWAVASPVGCLAGAGWSCIGAGDSVGAGAVFGGGGGGWDVVWSLSMVVLSVEDC